MRLFMRLFIRLWPLLFITISIPLSSFAVVNCTKEDRTRWLDQTKFQENLKGEGYKVKVFKVTKGNCYEIYGKNKDGKKVEIYFNPVTGDGIKSNIR